MRQIAMYAALLVLALPAYGQNSATTMDFHDLLYGNTTPLTLKLKDLNSDWRRVSIEGQSDAAGGMGMLGALFGGGGSSSGAVYYTKGQAVNIAGETYIVAYKANLKQPDLMSLIMTSQKNGGKEPDMSQLMPEKLTADSTLSLSLLNLKTSGNLTDIRPFDMNAEITDSANSGSNGLMSLMMLGMMADKDKDKSSTPKPSTTAAHPHKPASHP